MAKVMTKKELVCRIVAESKLSASQVDAVLTALPKVIADGLNEGFVVPIPDFGRFYTKSSHDRFIHHPVTGEPVYASGGVSPVFRASKVLKRAIKSTK